MRYSLLAQGHSDLGHLSHHMNDLMHKVLLWGFLPGAKHPDWVPAVDICETAEGYEIVVELAGVRREDIEVYTEKHHLTIAGWRDDPTPLKTRLHQMEIEQGQFCRRIHLPDDAEEDTVTARFRDGLLRIQIPKRR